MELVTSLLSSTGQHVTDALTEHDSEHGLTVLGQAVAWGHDRTVELLAKACKCEASSARLHPIHTACTFKIYEILYT